MTAAIVTAAIVAAAFIALGTFASRFTKREHARVWGLFMEADKMRRLANFARDTAVSENRRLIEQIAALEAAVEMLHAEQQTTPPRKSRRKIERAIG